MSHSFMKGGNYTILEKIMMNLSIGVSDTWWQPVFLKMLAIRNTSPSTTNHCEQFTEMVDHSTGLLIIYIVKVTGSWESCHSWSRQNTWSAFKVHISYGMVKNEATEPWLCFAPLSHPLIYWLKPLQAIWKHLPTYIFILVAQCMWSLIAGPIPIFSSWNTKLWSRKSGRETIICMPKIIMKK